MGDAVVIRGASAALARVLQLASAASPVGSFAYSEGLEQAVAAEDVSDAASARRWIEGLLRHGVCALDLPLLFKMHAAWSRGQAEDALRFSAWLLACRESAELRQGDRHQGQALARVAAEIGVGGASLLRNDRRVSYACAFAQAAAGLGVSAADAALAYGFAWLENMVVAAIKLVPLGHFTGQRILFDLAGALPERCEAAMTAAENGIAPGAPGLAVASALHETLATRLYRS